MDENKTIQLDEGQFIGILTAIIHHGREAKSHHNESDNDVISDSFITALKIRAKLAEFNMMTEDDVKRYVMGS